MVKSYHPPPFPLFARSIASVAYTVRHQASEYGVNVAADDVVVDFGAAMARLREIRARIAEADSAAKFIAAGV